MSTQYPGGFITKSPVAPTSSAASGIWTVDQALQYVKAGTWPSPPPPNYIEDVFSTYLYTGTGTARTIVNGINISTNGGLVWIKQRNSTFGHYLTYPGLNNGSQQGYISSETADAASYNSTGLTAFNTNGFTVDSNGQTNAASSTYVSWTFREQAKFFDVVTYTGTGANRTIAHNLGSAPGCMIVKRTDAGSSSWAVYHRSLTSAAYGIYLNTVDAEALSTFLWNSTAPTSTVFSVGTGGDVNASGGTYVAYLFAHDAGGFGLTGTDNVISCGTFTPVSNVATVTLGYEPQWVVIRRRDSTDSWRMTDVMRGMPTAGGDNQQLFANDATAEYAGASSVGVHPSATGFTAQGLSNGPYIYIAVRRGPMEVPTVGTSVFSPVAYTGDNSSNRVIGSLPAGDSALVFTRNYNDYAYPQTWWSRLTGGLALRPYNTDAEVNQATTLGWDNQVGQLISVGSANINYGGSPAGNFILYNYKRAPGYFDVVCYTGTGSATTVTHNLAAVPELMIVKARDRSGVNATGWTVWNTSVASTYGAGFCLSLNETTPAQTSPNQFASTAPTSSVFSVGTSTSTNGSSSTYVAYLFATCAGVSKVGSYTGTAALQTVACGFTSGARFVLIKRTDSTGDWYVWDSARGISSSTDPYLLLNSAAAEVTGTNYVDTDTTGFKVTAAASTTVNISAASYIFLAIA